MPIQINGTLTPRNDGEFATHDAQYGKGGLMTVPDLTARNNIPAGRRSAGMVVYVVGVGHFKLGDDLGTWTAFGGGGGPLTLDTFQEHPWLEAPDLVSIVARRAVEEGSFTAAAATGKLTCVSTDHLVDNDYFILDGGSWGPQTYEYQVTDMYSPSGIWIDVRSTPGVAADATLSWGRAYQGGVWIVQNNDNFILDDGFNPPTTIEFKVDGSFVPVPGRVVIDCTTIVFPDPWWYRELAALVESAINAIGDGLRITATQQGAFSHLVNNAVGAFGNIAIINNTTIEGPFFLPCIETWGFTGGVDIGPPLSAEEVATRTAARINESPEYRIAATPVADVVNLLNDRVGEAYNIPIEDGVADPAYLIEGMSGGQSGFSQFSTPRRLSINVETSPTSPPSSFKLRVSGKDTSERSIVEEKPLSLTGSSFTAYTDHAWSHFDTIEVIDLVGGSAPAAAFGSLSCIETSRLVNNDWFELDGGFETAPVKFEYAVDGSFVPGSGAKASGSVTCQPRSVLEGHGWPYFVLNDGVHGPTRIVEAVTVTGTLFQYRADEHWEDGSHYTGPGAVTIDLGDRWALGYIECANCYSPMGVSLVNNENFTISDGVNPPITFEYKVSSLGWVPTPGRTVIDIESAGSAGNIASATWVAVSGSGLSLSISISSSGTRFVIINNTEGPVGNVPITRVAPISGDAGGDYLEIVGMARGGTALTTAEETAAATLDAINNLVPPGTLNISATLAGDVVNLLNSLGGTAGNNPIGVTPWSPPLFAVTGMDGGTDDSRVAIDLRGAQATGRLEGWDAYYLQNNDHLILDDGINPPTTFEFRVDAGFSPVPGRVTVDVAWYMDDPSAIMSILNDAINAVGAGLQITGELDPESAWPVVILLENNVGGSAGNVAIIDNTYDTGWGKAIASYGMSGGGTPASTDAEVAAVTAAVINTQESGGLAEGTGIHATPAAAMVNLLNGQIGAGGNAPIDEHVADPGFVATGMSGGSGDFISLGRDIGIGLKGPMNYAPTVWNVTQLLVDGVVAPVPPFDPVYGAVEIPGAGGAGSSFKMYYSFTVTP